MSTITEKMHSPTKSMPTIFALCALAAFGIWGYQTKARVIPFKSLSEEHHIGEEKPKRKRVVLRPVQEPQASAPADDTIKSAATKPLTDESNLGRPELENE
jgi:hypothetical protein